MSLSTLKRILQDYGLKRRSVDIDENRLCELIQSEISGPGQLRGYRAVWHSLRLCHKVHVARRDVARILEELDLKEHCNEEAEGFQDDKIPALVLIFAGTLMVSICVRVREVVAVCQRNIYVCQLFCMARNVGHLSPRNVLRLTHMQHKTWRRQEFGKESQWITSNYILFHP